jgi:DNA-binding ferritin-like protein
MYKTKNDLAESARTQVVELCNARLADEAIDRSNELKDADTADVFTEISRGTDKWLWFVEAHLQAER